MSIDIKIWGNHTWNFLHILAAKINPDKFLSEKNDIIDVIKQVCRNLPCPDCSEHATGLLNRVDVNTINSKYDVELMLFYLHNNVNNRIKLPIQDISIIDKYKNGNLIIALNNIYQIYTKNSNTPKLMIQSLNRKQCIKTIYKYIIDNTDKFII